MTCREMDDILTNGGPLTDAAREHLRSCPRCRALEAALAAQDPNLAPRPEFLQSLHAPSPVKPVRPLAPAAAFFAAILVIVAALATMGGKIFGLYGLPALAPTARIVIFLTLTGLAVLAAFAAARDMRPGARRLRGGLLFVLSIATVETVFLSLFHDHGSDRFLHWGGHCLGAGLACAAPAGGLVWLLLRRGYIVSPVSTGAVIGVIAGLTGLTTLELHCPMLSLPHVAIWHGGVLVVSVAVGALVGWVARAARTRHLR